MQAYLLHTYQLYHPLHQMSTLKFGFNLVCYFSIKVDIHIILNQEKAWKIFVHVCVSIYMCTAA